MGRTELKLTKAQVWNYHALSDEDLVDLYTLVYSQSNSPQVVPPSVVKLADTLGVDSDQLKGELLRRLQQT